MLYRWQQLERMRFLVGQIYNWERRRATSTAPSDVGRELVVEARLRTALVAGQDVDELEEQLAHLQRAA